MLQGASGDGTVFSYQPAYLATCKVSRHQDRDQKARGCRVSQPSSSRCAPRRAAGGGFRSADLACGAQQPQYLYVGIFLINACWLGKALWTAQYYARKAADLKWQADVTAEWESARRWLPRQREGEAWGERAVLRGSRSMRTSIHVF